ncbi:MAG: TonB-dependent receptor, partial [Muribaculaceae bacterium]|nr:TonB-dependent receptor [Muribaculaceae bacterium]
RSLGGELSVKWRPAERLALNASYGYSNARFRRFYNGINDFKGKFLPYAPQNTIFAQAVYTIPTGRKWLGNIALDVNVKGTGKIYWNESNEDWQDFYAILGASCTLGDEKRSLQIWGRNLTDTRYHTFYFMSMGNEFFQRGRGLEFGATLRITI